MYYFVYIIKSESFDIFYKGYTSNPEKRLFEHNSNQSRYTSNKGPWKLVYLEKYKTKREALIREKKIKRYNSDYIRSLILQQSNFLNNYLE